VARLLLERGDKVRILVRRLGAAKGLDAAESFMGDLRDPVSLAQAVKGCEVVYHVAADYRLWAARPEDLYDSNTLGTNNLLSAAEKEGVDRFVYTSTVGCMGMPAGRNGDEASPVSFLDMRGAYKCSKYLAEQFALKAAERGFPVVIVNPTTPVGERDIKPTPTGKIIVDYLKRAMPAYLDTGLNFVDVHDAASGHLQACEHGVVGQRYILGSENLTLHDLFQKLERISGLKAPSVQIPYALAYAAGVTTTAWARLTGKEPRAPIDAVRMARKKMFVTHAKAQRELGFQPGSVDNALDRAVKWFRANGYC
jgi:dihydroflavonol-4-reductase